MKKNPMKNFLKEEKGQGMTEYGLILGLIGAVAVGAFALFGDSIKEKIGGITDDLFNKAETEMNK